MQDTFPKPVHGPDLRELRRSLGIQQRDLAAAIGIHRTRLYRWEADVALKPIQAARYERALRALVDKGTSGTHQAIA